MKIVIDCRFAGYRVGLGRYTRGIVNGILSHATDHEFVLITTENDSMDWLEPSANIQIIQTTARHYTLKEQYLIPKILREVKADLLFVPHFNIPIFTRVPIVTTIHDLILHEYPNTKNILKQLVYRFLLFLAVTQSRHIIAVSDFTKKELLRVYGSRYAAKISHITEGIEDVFYKRTPEEVARVCSTFGLHREYFLYVGNAKPHKNVPLLLEAWRQANCRNAQLVLVCSDSSIVTSKDTSVTVISTCTDEELASLYSGALAFVTASLYEGFCLPIIEARACNCPIIAANTSAITELHDKDMLLLEPNLQSFINAFNNKQSIPLESVSRPQNWNLVSQAVSSLLVSHG